MDIEFIRGHEVFDLFVEELPILLPYHVDHYLVNGRVQLLVFLNVTINKFVHLLQRGFAALFVGLEFEYFLVRCAGVANEFPENINILFQIGEDLLVS